MLFSVILARLLTEYGTKAHYINWSAWGFLGVFPDGSKAISQTVDGAWF